MCLVAKKKKRKEERKEEERERKRKENKRQCIANQHRMCPRDLGTSPPPPSLGASSFSVWLPLVVARWLLTVSATTVFSLVKESHFEKSLNVFSEK